ncbi:hypothetical protein Cal7507_4694 [Calothrix sp. PCC 7507]|nr:hypothetical protein Cal7507_4694 [Calothrix sp. PCC 7507]
MLSRVSPESPLFILLIIITFSLITFSAWLAPKPFALKPFGANEVMQLLTLPFFISLLLERSLEVFITTWRGPIAEQLDIGIQQQNLIVEQKRKLIQQLHQQNQIPSVEADKFILDPVVESSVGQQIIQDFTQYSEEFINKIKPQFDDLNFVINDLNKKERQRISYKSDTRIIALWTSLSLGLLLSTIGIRSIEPLVVVDDVVNPIQIIIFRCLDALLTGGLIAGGSEGIHKLIQVFIDFLEATSRQVKDK